MLLPCCAKLTAVRFFGIQYRHGGDGLPSRSAILDILPPTGDFLVGPVLSANPHDFLTYMTLRELETRRNAEAVKTVKAKRWIGLPPRRTRVQSFNAIRHDGVFLMGKGVQEFRSSGVQELQAQHPRGKANILATTVWQRQHPCHDSVARSTSLPRHVWQRRHPCHDNVWQSRHPCHNIFSH